MKVAHKKKSSFTLSVSEVPLVHELRKRLKLKSNTEVIRKALHEYAKNLDRDSLREQFRVASQLVTKHNKKDMDDLDHLSGEILE